MRVAIVLFAFCLSWLPGGGAGAEPAPVVAVEGGEIRGSLEEDGRVAVFKGIPFAAPPVGELRWKAPQPVNPWEGVRDATRFGSICHQTAHDDRDFFGRLVDGQGMGWFRRTLFKLAVGLSAGETESEDCLYLNVRTSNLEGPDEQPVMVWIHGGGHQRGSGSTDFYQSNPLTLRGVVLVTFNYRLGLMGNLAHPGLSAESEHAVSGNYGTLDQIAVLRWVRDHISGFGGDPDNVTIFGESAGGESVAHMMTSPLARGLFHRAIMQSPSTGELMVHLRRAVMHFESAEAAGESFAKQVTGDEQDPLGGLRAMSAKELLARAGEFSEFDKYHYPIVDGFVLPKSVLEAFLAGDQARVPLVVGSNADEGSLLYSSGNAALYGRLPGPTTAEEYEQYLRESLGTDAARAIELYPANDDDDVFDAASRVYGDSRFGTTARLYARRATDIGQPTYLYFFTRVPPSPKQTVGAFHAAEIVFVFDKSVPLFPADEQDLVIRQTMGDFWTQFARAGDPNREELPDWPQFSREEPRSMVFGREIGATPIERADAYDIFERDWLRLIETIRGKSR